MVRAVGRLLASLLVATLLLSTVASAAGPGPWVTPLELDFGPIGVGLSAPQQAVTITNTGSTPLANFAGGGLFAPFTASQDCVIPGGVPPGGHCHYFFGFTPLAAGVFTATSSSATNAGSFTVVVHGRGLGASVVADSTALDFGTVHKGYTSATQVVTLRNTGPVPLVNFAGGGVPAPFGDSQDCVIPGGIPTGGTCHFFFTFSPTTAGGFGATSSISVEDVNINITLQGTGSFNFLSSGQC